MLCVDKTGTLTENRISLVNYCDLEGRKNDEIIEFASYLTSKFKAIKVLNFGSR